MSTVAVVIPTRNRQKEIQDCLLSLSAQKMPPDYVIVSDSSEDEATADVCRRLGNTSSLDVVYVRSPESGVTRQRNAGLRELRPGTDFVMFSDDDIEFDEHYIEMLVVDLECEEHADAVGAAGVTEGAGSVSWSRTYSMFASIFFLGSRRKLGQILSSGVNVAPPDTGSPVYVAWLFGCAMYRAKAVGELRFADELGAGYAYYDDVDYSLRAALFGRLLIDPRARLVHHESSVARQGLRAATKMNVVNRHWLLARHRDIGTMPAYWWSVIGLILLYGIRGPVRGRADDVERFRGVVDAVLMLSRGNGPQ